MAPETRPKDSSHALSDRSSSMLAPFIYDTSSLQDCLIQGAGVASTTTPTTTITTTTTTYDGKLNRK
ncbi:hypothetical protein FALBO_11005 [Fusarium albosuccineum]|uniref:Uncharacterized protein n=1 Tax=Fusarium albosuccineum TaxID=1237068 RepID=A0A8H4L329_9HYPO|nr:hypothetical protein FALBO_11005 [Fusarium albosuccineum]